ncbi:hypothetical protein V7S43_011988 [Phytophthora oleae]|uniref:Dynein regulatory complex protein 1/2 N-terminal domain-containing protein n=1 Tax=Phytophthora oleae TaxID=2107226 RepID=A0ABD3F869_9STRA
MQQPSHSQLRDQRMQYLENHATTLRVKITNAEDVNAKKKLKADKASDAAFKYWRAYLTVQGKAIDAAKELNDAESKRIGLEKEFLETQREFQELNQQKFEEERMAREREEIQTPD